jgi:hypothetical protein
VKNSGAGQSGDHSHQWIGHRLGRR